MVHSVQTKVRGPLRSVLADRWLILIVGLLTALVATPFLLNLAGDAQVHLAIAQNFVRGMPFQYNAGGETVVATTSPAWTIMLALFYKIASSWAPLLMTVVILLAWLTSAYLLYRTATQHWFFTPVAVWLLLMLWLLHTTVVANALGGLENIVSALQLLLFYSLTACYLDGLTSSRSLLLGLLLGWTLLTRPDGGLFALILMAQFVLALWPVVRRRPKDLAGQLAIIAVTTILILTPWYTYQYSLTGRLIADSSIARLYGGRQGSLVLIPGLLYLHPKALITLGTAFLPIMPGFLIVIVQLALSLVRSPGARLQQFRREWPRYAAVVLVIAGFLFYTLAVGAESFGRYFLPLFPFLFLAGVDGWIRLFRSMVSRGWRLAAVVLVLLAALFMAVTSVADLYRRLGPGRFSSDQVSNVFYGPANNRYYSVNLPAILRAPQRRPANTAELLAFLGAAQNEEPSMAVTEVQLRYFVDDRIKIISLDGRTSAKTLHYIDPITGVPDFESYFLDVRPDYVHANQWCAVGGWLDIFFTVNIDDNLVCSWQKQAARMQLGDSFEWQGHQVTLAAPELFRIEWEDSDPSLRAPVEWSTASP